jgi:ABC-type transport system substrate-binding protein
MATNARAGVTKTVAAIVLVVIIIAAAATAILYTGSLSGSHPQLSIAIASSTNVGTARTPVSFNVISNPANAIIQSVSWNFGDGTNATTTNATTVHIYANGGYYLVSAQVTANLQGLVGTSNVTVTNDMALFPIQIQANVNLEQSTLASIPTINFLVANNSKAPLFDVNEIVYPVGGFLEAPSNGNWTIQKYTWNFGNGQTQTVEADSSRNGLPLRQVTTSYSTPGIYPISLTLTTNSSVTNFAVTTIRSVAVSSTGMPFALLTSKTGVVNQGVITAAEVVGGGPSSFDPEICYEYLCNEVVLNVFQTLTLYNGSSPYSWIPYLATQVPSQQNGGISSDFKTYTFTIRDNQYFSNGDPVTAYDVWFSFARGMAFTGGTPGTPSWALDQYLIPGVQNGTANVFTNNTWAAASSSITYSSNTVTFHFNRPVMPAILFFLLSGEGYGIIDSKYAVSLGAGFSQANWDSYKNQANMGFYNEKMQWDPVGSGPYMVGTYLPGQSILLVPNPYYQGVPMMPRVADKVVIDWVKTPDTALLMLQDGEADSAYGLPSSDFPTAQQLQSQGLVKIYSFPTATVYYFNFNIEVDKQLESATYGSSYNEPSNYFADLPTRMAWINAWDYEGFINNIVGNLKYGTNFAQRYIGALAPQLQYHIDPSQVGGLPTQNLKFAEGNFSESAWHDTKITVPVLIYAGDLTAVAGVEEWATTLNQISGGNITAVPLQVSTSQYFGGFVPNADPCAVGEDNWYPDMPSDLIIGMLGQGGYNPNGMNWFVSNFESLPPQTPYDMVRVNGTTYTQAQIYKWIDGNVTLATTSADAAVVERGYRTAQELAIDMGLYLYYQNTNSLWYWRSDLGGSSYEQNPVTMNASGGLYYAWVTKG